jgi:hypothetical protein
MIVLGADMHTRSHTIAAVSATTGELAGEKTIAVGARGFAAALDWARGLGGERVWALEDCRHVSGALERFLLVRGERVVRVAPWLTAGERRNGRDRGKSDRIDAIGPGSVAAFPTGDGATPRLMRWAEQVVDEQLTTLPSEVAMSFLGGEGDDYDRLPVEVVVEWNQTLDLPFDDVPSESPVD